MSSNVQNAGYRFFGYEFQIFLLNENFRKRIVRIFFQKVCPVIVAQGNGMMKLVKVIKAKVSQQSPAEGMDFKKFGPKSLQLIDSIFLSFLDAIC